MYSVYDVYAGTSKITLVLERTPKLYEYYYSKVYVQYQALYLYYLQLQVQ